MKADATRPFPSSPLTAVLVQLLGHVEPLLSPRAADALDMKRAGVAAIVLEPLVNQAAPTAAVFQTSDTSMEEMPALSIAK